jgi:D-aminopeptidase
VYNALTAATTVQGRDGHIREALPLDRVETLLREAGRIE